MFAVGGVGWLLDFAVALNRRNSPLVQVVSGQIKAIFLTGLNWLLFPSAHSLIGVGVSLLGSALFSYTTLYG